MIKKTINENDDVLNLVDLENNPHNISKEELSDLNQYIKNNGLTIDVLPYRDNSLYADVTWGDWKHDHLRLQYLVNKFFEDKNVNLEHYSKVTEEDGSDTYSAEHIWIVYDKDNKNNELSESANDVGPVKTLDDVASDLINNMSDDLLDSNIRLFNKIAKELDVTNFADVYVFAHDGTYNLNDYKDKFEYVKDLYKIVKEFDDIKVFKLGDIKLIQEFNDNNNYFIYAKSEDDLDKAVEVIDNYYNDTEAVESLNNHGRHKFIKISDALNKNMNKSTSNNLIENTDTAFNDKYFPRVDINDGNYEYYKYKDKEFVYDKNNKLLIFIFKDEDEIAALGDDAPYRELDTVGFNREFWDNKEERDSRLDSYISDLDAETDRLLSDFIKYELPQYKNPSVNESRVINEDDDNKIIYFVTFDVDLDLSYEYSDSESEIREDDGLNETVDHAINDLMPDIRNTIRKYFNNENIKIEFSDKDIWIRSDDYGTITIEIHVDSTITNEQISEAANKCIGLVGSTTDTFSVVDPDSGTVVGADDYIPACYAGWTEYDTMDADVDLSIEITKVSEIELD